jgi:hypothetical protein
MNEQSYRSRDRSVGLATGYGLVDRGLIPGKSKNSVLLHSVRTSSGSHTTSYIMDTRDSSGKNGRSVKLTTPSSDEVKNGGPISPLPVLLHGILHFTNVTNSY